MGDQGVTLLKRHPKLPELGLELGPSTVGSQKKERVFKTIPDLGLHHTGSLFPASPLWTVQFRREVVVFQKWGDGEKKREVHIFVQQVCKGYVQHFQKKRWVTAVWYVNGVWLVSKVWLARHLLGGPKWGQPGGCVSCFLHK